MEEKFFSFLRPAPPLARRFDDPRIPRDPPAHLDVMDRPTGKTPWAENIAGSGESTTYHDYVPHLPVFPRENPSLCPEGRPAFVAVGL